jgi:multidrug efflux pump subunit AcrB
MLMRKNKKFITVMVGLIIIVLLFSVIAIVALYTSPQPTFQIPAQNIEAVINGGTDSEAVLQ